MRERKMTVKYGEHPQGYVCKLGGHTAYRFGTLIDPNGHKWIICTECIDYFWAGNAAVIREEEVERRAAQLLQDKILGSGDNV